MNVKAREEGQRHRQTDGDTDGQIYQAERQRIGPTVRGGGGGLGLGLWLGLGLGDSLYACEMGTQTEQTDWCLSECVYISWPRLVFIFVTRTSMIRVCVSCVLHCLSYGGMCRVSCLCRQARQADASVGRSHKECRAICLCLLVGVGAIDSYFCTWFSRMCLSCWHFVLILSSFYVFSHALSSPKNKQTEKNKRSGETSARQFSLHIRWRKNSKACVSDT
jgi:hypothetical protein